MCEKCGSALVNGKCPRDATRDGSAVLIGVQTSDAGRHPFNVTYREGRDK